MTATPHPAYETARELARDCAQQCRNLIRSSEANDRFPDLEAFIAFVDGFIDDYGLVNLFDAVAARERRRAFGIREEIDPTSRSSGGRRLARAIERTADALTRLSVSIQAAERESERRSASRRGLR
jgi:hypothetical protein